MMLCTEIVFLNKILKKFYYKFTKRKQLMEICNGAEHTVAKIGTRKRYIYRVISDFFSLKR